MRRTMRHVGAALAVVCVAWAAALPVGTVAVGAQSQPPRAVLVRQLAPVVRGTLACMAAVRHTLHDIHAGEALAGAALTSYIQGPLTRDVRAERLTCLHDQERNVLRQEALPRTSAVRSVVGHAVAFEGPAGLYGVYWMDSVTQPNAALRQAFAGYRDQDGAAMLREMRAFVRGLAALTGQVVPLL